LKVSQIGRSNVYRLTITKFAHKTRNGRCPLSVATVIAQSVRVRRRRIGLRPALASAHAAGRLAFFGKIQDLHRREAFTAHLAPLPKLPLRALPRIGAIGWIPDP
jgi:hypothetical protein